jgi:hypothetical protein
VKIPPRTATDQYLARRGEHLDIVFDLDLGELVNGHHVVARGIMLGRPARDPATTPPGCPAWTGAARTPAMAADSSAGAQPGSRRR